jgi:hypothetical protein
LHPPPFSFCGCIRALQSVAFERLLLPPHVALR